jgi:hypothetical protein
MKSIKKNLIYIVILSFILSGCYDRGVEEADIMKISPFKEYENALVQLYLPNRNLKCIITELSGVSNFDQSNEIMESLNHMKKRTSESYNFVQMKDFNFLNVSVVSDTAFIEYDNLGNTDFTEMEECLLLYSIINTVANTKGVDFVKLTNNSSSKQFIKYYNIEAPFSSTNTLLYKDYQSPIETIKNFLDNVIEGKEPASIAESEINNIIYNLSFDAIGYRIKTYEYNKYGEFITANVQIVLTDSFRNITTVKLSFLLELSGGKFVIKEII